MCNHWYGDDVEDREVVDTCQECKKNIKSSVTTIAPSCPGAIIYLFRDKRQPDRTALTLRNVLKQNRHAPFPIRINHYSSISISRTTNHPDGPPFPSFFLTKNRKSLNNAHSRPPASSPKPHASPNVPGQLFLREGEERGVGRRNGWDRETSRRDTPQRPRNIWI